MSKDYKDLLVALDIGTSKVVAIVAELKGEGHYEVIGLGQSESKGLKKGVVVNIEATVQSIQRALEEAEDALLLRLRDDRAHLDLVRLHRVAHLQ